MILHINQTLKKWQKRLGLSDWDITVDFTSQNHVSGQAKVTVYTASQKATIFLLNEDDRQKSDPNDQDIEFDLVHELIHVRLWSFDPLDAKGNDHILREQAIDWISKALLQLERKDYPTHQDCIDNERR